MAALAALLVCCGCAAQPADAGSALFATEDGRMTFTFPAGWTADAESRAFDLVCRDEARELSAGVFSYTREGAAMPFEPSEALDFHVEDFCARLEDAGEPGGKEERADGGTLLYVGAVRGGRNRLLFHADRIFRLLGAVRGGGDDLPGGGLRGGARRVRRDRRLGRARGGAAGPRPARAGRVNPLPVRFCG